MLELYNTAARQQQPFEPADGKIARVYSCGPTVYDVAHVGNLRTFVFSDILCRYLAFKGWEVRQVMNITDVDDKTIAGAQACDSSSSTCTGEQSSYSGAHEAIRMKDFMNNYIGTGATDNGVFADICTTIMADALTEAMEKMEVICDDFVLE